MWMLLEGPGKAAVGLTIVVTVRCYYVYKALIRNKHRGEGERGGGKDGAGVRGREERRKR